MSDAVNHPPHYTAGAVEVIDVIEDWNLGFHLGNTVKYIARARHKGTYLKDLQKAHWYLSRLISQSLIDLGPPTRRDMTHQPEDIAVDWQLSETLAFVLTACATRRGLVRSQQMLADLIARSK